MAGWGGLRLGGITHRWGHAAIAKTAGLPVCLSGARRPEQETAQTGRPVQRRQPKARANREGQQMRLNTAFAADAGQNRPAAALRGGDALCAKRHGGGGGGATKHRRFIGQCAAFCRQQATAGAWAVQVQASEHPGNKIIRKTQSARPRCSARAAEKLPTCGNRKWKVLTRYGQRYPSLENPS